jgi:hypothetical protein
MKKWRLILFIAGILLLLAALIAYAARIASCYPPAATYAQFSLEQVKAFRESCQMDSPLTTQFSDFLWLFIPGISLFSAFWLLNLSKDKNRRSRPSSVFLLIAMFDSLLVALLSLLEYPAPGSGGAQSAGAMGVIAALGFLCYLAGLALWHWKRWGLLLFQGASVTLAVFILLSGGSLLLAAVIIGGVIGLSIMLRPLRSKFI